MDTEYKKFELEFIAELEKIKKHYNTYEDIQKTFNLGEQISKYPIDIQKLVNSTEEEFRVIIVRFIQSQIRTSQSLDVYSLMSVKDLFLPGIGALLWISTKVIGVKINNNSSREKVQIYNQERKEIYSTFKEFKEKYTESKINLILNDELKRICKLNGIILN